MDKFEEGYIAALEDLLNDECQNPMVVQARELLDKKEHLANR